MNIIKESIKRFEAWLRYNPPFSLSARGWRLFNAEYKEVAPIRFWLMKHFKKTYVLPIKWKYIKMIDWIRYRTYDRYHIIKTGLPPSYYDPSVQMLHVNFNILKDFVEVEQAWSSYSLEERKKASWAEKYIPFYFHFFPFRRPDLGIEYFNWGSTLDDPALPPHERSVRQAESSREILALYKWWVEERPARKPIPSPSYDDQGLGVMGCFDADFDETAKDFEEYNRWLSTNSAQEDKWDDEDQDMLIRLMKVRQSLWS